jgi:hypothetical protein
MRIDVFMLSCSRLQAETLRFFPSLWQGNGIQAVFLAYRVVFCDRSISTELRLAISASVRNRSVGKKNTHERPLAFL